MSSQDFLVELGTEELPPKALQHLSSAFTNDILASLDKVQISYGQHKSFASPRRLALLIKDLQTSQPEQKLERRGPAIESAFDSQNKPTKAAEGFARSNGVSVDQLETLTTDKGSWLVYRSAKQGEHTASLIPDIIHHSLLNLPIPKRMRWGARREEFVRPVHWLVTLLGSDVIDCEILGLKSSRHSHGHRFHANEAITIDQPSNYQKILEDKGWVLVDIETRKEMIRKQVIAEADKLNGTAIICEQLLDEVTALVEWPTALSGRFDDDFLSVPAEALISSMKEHQKYFHIVDDHNALKPFFITISNIKSKDPQQVVSGNERVIRPRLADAKFFFETDKKTTLEACRERLKAIVFQAQLGSLLDKTERISKLSAWIAYQEKGDAEVAKRAGQLSKSDLVSNMVLEFPDLQGIMGQYYAANDGEHEEVSQAINEQYMPRFAGDKLPSSLTSNALAIADRIDTITGIFGIGQPPTGSKDPFALRRASIGVLRIIVDKKLNLDLVALVQQASEGYLANNIELPKASSLTDTIVDYMLERFDATYQEEGVSREVIKSVKTIRPTRPLDFDRRIKAISRFYQLSEAGALASANKRVSNILTKSSDLIIPDTVDESLLIEKEEITLAKQLTEKRKEVTPLLEQGLYTSVMEALATLKEPIDQFFNKVYVNSEDKKTKLNRYALLMQLRSLFLHVADISLLQKSTDTGQKST